MMFERATHSPGFKFVLFSAIGMVSFFVPLSFGGRSTILIDHLVTLVTQRTTLLANVFAAALILWGVFSPLVSGRWKESATTRVLSVLQILAIPLGVMYLTSAGPEFAMAPDMLPFLFEKLAVPVGLIIPIGAFFLTFLLGFGLLEAIGVFMEPIMRPVFRTPGRSAIDAVASFAGSYSVGLLITSRVYRSGMYSAKEAAIIATGFSTVSATFMVIVAKTLSLTDYWNAYFFGTLAVTFVVTAITVRLPPLRSMDNSSKAGRESRVARGNYVKAAFAAGLTTARQAPKVAPLLRENVVDGLLMATRVVPSILSIGFLGLLAAKYTPLFDFLGQLLTPVLWVFFAQSAAEIGSFLASGLAEMFLPAVQSVDQDLAVRYVVGSVSVSSILFLSASIPCILAARIPLTLGQMLVIWAIRTVLSIPLAYAAGWLFAII